MKTYLVIFIVATLASFSFTPLITRVCARLGWLDNPQDGRKVHQTAVPRLGGVAIFASMAVSLLLLFPLVNAVTEQLSEARSALISIIVPSTLVFLFGVYDDFRGANAKLKFVAQALAAVVFYFLGGGIQIVSMPFIGAVHFPEILSFALTVLWVVGISNAFNLIDGIDGLATGAALFASVVMMLVSLVTGHELVSVLVLALSGALIGFLPYNFSPASIFLGDSGSLLIGFILAAVSIRGMQKASTAVAVAIPLMAFGLPVLDTGFAIMRRFISGRPIFQGDREHIHHRLLARGWSQRQVAFVLYGVCALFGLQALVFLGDTSGRMTGLILIVVGAAILFGMAKLRYHEVDEIKATIRRNLTLSERRQRISQNVHIRRASEALARCNTLADLFKALSEMLEFAEFAFAVVRIGYSNPPSGQVAILLNQRDQRSPETAEQREGIVEWTWSRDGLATQDVVGSSRFWALRLPLASSQGELGYINLYRSFESEELLLDINYICNLFQRQMAEAAERILQAVSEESPENFSIVGAGD